MNEKGIAKIEALAVEAASRVVEINGQKYAHDSLKPKHLKFPTCEPIKLSTLTGLVDLLGEDPDDWLAADAMLAPIIHVVSPTRVELRGIQRDDDFRTRDTFVIVERQPIGFQFGAFHDREMFQIMLMSMFDETPDRENVLKLIGNIEQEQKVTTKDNGTSQNVVAKTGIVGVDNFEVPNPVLLAPFRSFHEVEPVSSEMVLRIGGGGGRPITAALFEADGGGWALETVKRIADYLAKALATDVVEKVVIIR